MSKNKSQLQVMLEEILEGTDLSCASHYARGNCVSVDIHSNNIGVLFEVIVEKIGDYSSQEISDFSYELGRMRIDTKGYDCVAYFPGIPFVDDAGDDDNDDDGE